MVLFSPFSHHDSSSPAARSLSQVGSDFIGFGENSTKVPKIGTQKIGRNGISIFKRKSKKNFAAQWLEINLKKSHFYRFIMDGLHLLMVCKDGRNYIVELIEQIRHQF